MRIIFNALRWLVFLPLGLGSLYVVDAIIFMALLQIYVSSRTILSGVWVVGEACAMIPAYLCAQIFVTLLCCSIAPKWRVGTLLLASAYALMKLSQAVELIWNGKQYIHLYPLLVLVGAQLLLTLFVVVGLSFMPRDGNAAPPHERA